MNVQELKRVRQVRRKHRGRRKLFGTPERPRLSVSRTHMNIDAQIIDDISGKTLVSAGTKSKSMSDQVKSGANVKAAEAVGVMLAERARMQGITKVCFDRGGRRFHGRIKALAEAARKTGLEF